MVNSSAEFRFTAVAITATFEAPHVEPLFVQGFADSADGTLYRLPFSPAVGGVDFRHQIRFSSRKLGPPPIAGDVVALLSRKPE